MLFLWFIFTLLPLLCLLFFVTFWWFLFMLRCDTWSALVSECKALSWEFLNSLRKHFPWCHGATDNMTGGASLHHLSDGYFYINLPPIFMCLLSVVLMYLSSKKKNKLVILLYKLLFSLTKNTWPQRASPTVNLDVCRLCSTYMLLLERELLFMWVYSKSD